MCECIFCLFCFCPKGFLERSINLAIIILDYRMKLSYPEIIYKCTGRICKSPCRKTRGWNLNPGPYFYKATVLPTVEIWTSSAMVYIISFHICSVERTDSKWLGQVTGALPFRFCSLWLNGLWDTPRGKGIWRHLHPQRAERWYKMDRWRAMSLPRGQASREDRNWIRQKLRREWGSGRKG